MTRDVRTWIDRWVEQGLLEDGIADRLREDVAGAGPGDREADGGLTDLLPGSARSMVLEAVGYLGAALTIGALGALFDVTDWPRPVIVALLALASALAGWGTWKLTPPTSDASSRLAAVLGAVAVGTLAAALFQAVEPDCFVDRFGDRCGWVEDNLLPFVILLLVTAAAAAVHRRHTTVVGHGVLGWAAVALTWSVAHLPFGPSSSSTRDFATEESLFGLLLVVVGLAWTWAAETGRLEPAWVGTFGAAGAFFAGLLMATGYDPIFGSSDDLPTLVALAAGAAWLLVGVQGDRLRLTIVGTVALLFAIPTTLLEVLDLSQATVTLVMLPIGIALMAWAVREGRRAG